MPTCDRAGRRTEGKRSHSSLPTKINGDFLKRSCSQREGGGSKGKEASAIPFGGGRRNNVGRERVSEPGSTQLPEHSPRPENDDNAAKRQRTHAEMEVRPGEEDDEEPDITEESVGKRRRILRIGDREVVLEKGAEGLRVMAEEECKAEDDQESRWEAERELKILMDNKIGLCFHQPKCNSGLWRLTHVA